MIILRFDCRNGEVDIGEEKRLANNFTSEYVVYNICIERKR